MKILTHPDTYQCEYCNAEYLRADLALLCETTTLPLPKFKSGDKVLVESRYDGFFRTIVTEVELVHDFEFNSASDSIPVKGQLVPVLEYAAAYINHHWEYTTKLEVEVCNDGTISNKWNENELISITEWNTSYFDLPNGDNILVRMVGKDNKIVIRRGDKEWFEKYWSNHNFLGWRFT